MDQIRYNEASNVLRFDFPSEWAVKDITSITLTVKDADGNVLSAADATTLWTQTVLDSAATQYSDQITLDSGADDLTIGNMILIEGVTGDEVRRVRGYDTVNQVVQLEGILDYAHAADDKVWGLFGSYTLDTSDTDVYTAGIFLTLLWTPDTDDTPTRQLVQVSAAALDFVGIRGEFKDAHPRYYDGLTTPIDRFERLVKQVERDIYNELAAESHMFTERVVDQSVLIDVMMDSLCLKAMADGDTQHEDERKFFSEERARHMDIVKRRVLWTDDNQDDIKAEEENSSHEQFYLKEW